MRGEYRGIVGAADILLGAARAATFGVVAGEDARDLLIELRELLVGEELPVRVLCRPLERGVGVSLPDALKIRLAPRCLGRGTHFCRWCRRLRGRRLSCHRLYRERNHRKRGRKTHGP